MFAVEVLPEVDADAPPLRRADPGLAEGAADASLGEEEAAAAAIEEGCGGDILLLV